MIIILMGYMASGKSTIGKKLAEKINYNVVDLDDVIEEKEKATVTEIFKNKGEIYFRKKETEYLKEILNTSDKIILSLGGGTPCFGNNMDLILSQEKAKSVYLKASLPKLVTKLMKKKAKRPLIAHIETEEELTEFIGKHLFERSAYYNRAEVVISTDNKSKKEIVTEMVATLF
ncbi:shikimate kinase [Neotamlana laminarinivorans]|uniref:Shikimate kinase n=1 Tax=Neotamlana laminarinivorans TaxID=2883124 RepID=A0A9X1L1R7_9FLAO|nr:shikimate kinase [Tamlana laminarinivorans]MCB4799018.1 dephospho-CoA kinase [Tamlana laminarinivorans]